MEVNVIDHLVLVDVTGHPSNDRSPEKIAKEAPFEKMLLLEVSLDDIIVFVESNAHVVSPEEYSETYRASGIPHNAYHVYEVLPRAHGIITDRTAIFRSFAKGTSHFDRQGKRADCSPSAAICINSKILRRGIESSHGQHITLLVKPSISLAGFDCLVVLRPEDMKYHGVVSGQMIKTISRQLFAVSDGQSFVLNDTASEKIQTERRADRIYEGAFVSPTLFYNLGCPASISFEVENFDSVESGSPSLESGKNGHIILHPLTAGDIYSSSLALTVDESVRTYTVEQGSLISWTDGDILVLPVSGQTSQARAELEFARANDLLEHRSNFAGGRYAYFLVENSGSGGSSVSIGSSVSLSDEHVKLVGVTEVSEDRMTLLPPVPPPKLVAIHPVYSLIRDRMAQLSRAALDERVYHEKHANSDLPGPVRRSQAFTRTVVHGSEENCTLDLILAGLGESGRQPVIARLDIMELEEVADLAKITLKEPSMCLVLLLSPGRSTSEQFFVTLQELIDEFPTHLPIVVYLDGVECPLSFKNNFPPACSIPKPNAEERASFIRSLLKEVSLSRLISISDIAENTKYMSYHDLMTVFTGFPIGLTVTEDTVHSRIKAHAELIGVNPTSKNIERISWKDVGGLEEQKQLIVTRLTLPMKFPHLYKSRKTSGILFYGPPGCGKTLLAKAIATEFNIGFINVKGPELLNMYVGQSEKNIRETFQRARESSPCILFFDELDSLAPNRAGQSDSGGVMSRIVSQLLTELDGINSDESDGCVFVFGATNRIDLIDKSLLRPGRFDYSCFLGPPTTKEEILHTLRALVRKLDLRDDVNLDAFIDAFPTETPFTGADLYGIVSNALLLAYDESGGFTLQQNHLLRAMEEHSPSLDANEMRKYQRVDM